MTAIFNNFSIRYKLISAFTVFALVIGLFVFFFFPYQQKLQILVQAKEKSIAIAKMTADNLAVSITFDDKVTTREVLNILKDNDDFEFVLVKDANDDFFEGINPDKATKTKELEPSSNTAYLIIDNIAVTTIPIRSKKERVGTLLLGVSIKNIKATIDRNTNIALTISVLLVVILVLASLFISSIITKPIHKVIDISSKIAQGDFSTKLEVSSSDEVGQLADAFNQMSEKLETGIKELEQSEERYRLNFEKVSDVITSIDINSTVLDISPSIEKFLGYKPEELIGKKLTTDRFLTLDSLQEFEKNKTILLSGEQLIGLEYEFITKDGTHRYGEVSSTPLFNDGKVERIVSVIRDITERKQFDQNLKEAKDFLESIIESSRDGIIIVDVMGNILSSNTAMERFSGLSKEEIKGKHASELIVKDEDIRKNILEKTAELFEKGFTSYEALYKAKEGNIIEVECISSMIKDDKGDYTGGVSIIRDISERKQFEKDLQKAKEVAESANEAKSNFLANMSHEIRTPMNGIIGFTDMLLETKVDPEQTDFALTIRKSGEALLSLINDILDFSKIEAGKMDLEPIDFDIEVIAYDVCELIRPRVEKGKVELLCRIADDLPAMINGDPHRFRQVLINLMGNAAKFAKAGEIELSLDVKQEKDDRILVHTKVRDTGIGIAKDKIETIFDVFQQADTSTTRQYGGTGLGLAICKQIAYLMGGKVWLESEQGKGSTFHFTAWLSKTADKKAKRIIPALLHSKKVVIADDNEANLEILKNTLKAAGMDVVAFHNGEDVLGEIKQACEKNQPFDIGIFDVMMPIMNGYELAQKIRSSIGESMPLLAFSSSPEGSAKKSRESGFNGFLPKPINRTKMLAMISHLLGGQTSEACEKQPAELVTQYSMIENQKGAVSILLAEDNPVNQKLAEKLLTKAGYSVDIANNGQEAVDKYVATPDKYDIIFMDVQMPVLNGLEATMMLRKKGFSKLPIVAVTANAMKDDREKCLASGMDDYIAKPIKRELVFGMLKKWVIDKA